MGELMGCAVGSTLWFTRIDVRGLSGNTRRLILERVKSKLRFNKTLEALGIARGSLHNYLNGVRRIPDNVVYKEV
jgi:hypothetical protein